MVIKDNTKIFIHILLFFCLFYLSTIYGYNIYTYTFNQVGTFDDFENLLKLEADSITLTNNLGLTPFLIDFYRQINRFGNYNLILINSLLNLILLFIVISRIDNKNKFLLSILTINWPLIFLFSRGNNDIYILLLSILLFFVIKKNFLKSLSFALIMSIDPIYFIFCFLFICLKQFKILLNSIIIFLLLNLPLLLRKDLLNWNIIKFYLNQIFYFRDKMVFNENGSMFSNSLEMFFNALKHLNLMNSVSASFILRLLIFIIISLLIYTSVLFLKIKSNYNFNYFGICLSSYFLVFSPTPDYKLIFLLIPLIGNWANLKITELLLIEIIWLPKHFFHFAETVNFAGYTISSIVNPLLLLLLFSYYTSMFLKNHFTKSKNLVS